LSVNDTTRRAFVTGGAAAATGFAATGTCPLGPAGAQTGRATIPFGVACNHYVLPTDAGYREALGRHADFLVAEGAMKWRYIKAKRESFDFTSADQVVRFAARNGQRVRGHTLVWCADNPDWVKTIGTAVAAEREMVTYIERVVGHFRASVRNWDVVNEPIAEKPSSEKDLREGTWPQHMGPRYIDIAFRAAHQADPGLELVINEYGIEGATDRDRLKRAAYRRLILELKSRGVPLHGVGIQAHLDGNVAVDMDGMTRFCAEMKGLGLKILITELDVNDYALPADTAERDRIVADRVRAFLSAVTAAVRPDSFCTWGLTDRYTWMPTWFKRKDGLSNRPLPFDSDLKAKPLWSVIQEFRHKAI
jgi:endo-1,4-beta-xylanase